MNWKIFQNQQNRLLRKIKKEENIKKIQFVFDFKFFN